MWVATCRQCGRCFTTIRDIDEHCPSCQPVLPGLTPEQRPLFRKADLEVVPRRPEAGSERGPKGRIPHFPKG